MAYENSEAADKIGGPINRIVALGKAVYDTWYGAVALFLAVSAALFGLQVVNEHLGDVVPWPKDAHVLVMIGLALNIGVAAIVSAFVRRKLARAFELLAMMCAALAGSILVGVVVCCLPTRMTTPPCDEWVDKTICSKTGIGKERLQFLGGISARESTVVYEVSDGAIDCTKFSPGSPWTSDSDDSKDANAIYPLILKRCHIDVPLPDNAAFYHCDCTNGFITIIKASDKGYLVYQRL